jgi:hypothetical protein
MDTTPVPWYNRWQFFVGAAGVLLLFLALAFAIVATIFGWWPVVLDIVLSFAALVQVFIVIALVVAVIILIRTLRELKAEVTPVLESLKATSSAVQATTTSATNFGVKPAIRTASLVVGAGEVASVVLGRGHTRKRAEKRQRRRQEIERELAEEEQAGAPVARDLVTRRGLDGAR